MVVAVPPVPDAAVVGRHPGIGEQPGALGTGCVAEADQRRRAAQLVLPDRERRDPHPATHEQRPASVLGRAEPESERPDEEQVLTGLELA